MPVTGATNVQTAPIYQALEEVGDKSQALRNAGSILIDQAIVKLQNAKKTINVDTTRDPQKLKNRKIQTKTIDSEIKQLQSLKKETQKQSIESGNDAQKFTSKLLRQVLLSLGNGQAESKNLVAQMSEIEKLTDGISRDYGEISMHIQDIANEHIGWAYTEQPELGKLPAKTSKGFAVIVDKLRDLTAKCQRATRKALTQATSSLDSLLRKETQEIEKAVAGREKTVSKNGKMMNPMMQEISELRSNLAKDNAKIEGFIGRERYDIDRLKEELPNLSQAKSTEAKHKSMQSLHNTLVHGSKNQKLTALDRQALVSSERIANLEKEIKSVHNADNQLSTSRLVEDNVVDFVRDLQSGDYSDPVISRSERDEFQAIRGRGYDATAELEIEEKYLRSLGELREEIASGKTKPNLTFIEDELSYLASNLITSQSDLAQARALAERELGLDQFEASLNLVTSDRFLQLPQLDNDNDVRAWIKQREGVLDQINHSLEALDLEIEQFGNARELNRAAEQELFEFLEEL